MCGRILSLILVLGLVSSASAVTAADAELTVETALGIDAITTYLELTNSTTGDTREGFSIVQAASGDDWGYPDSSDDSIFVNTNSLDDKSHAASDFLVTLSGLAANTDYSIYVCAAGKTGGGGKLEYDFSWGALEAGSADNNVDSVYNAPGAIELVSESFGGDVKHNMAVPIAIFTSDGSGNLSFYLGKGNNHQGSDADRTQLDGIIVIPLWGVANPDPDNEADRVSVNPTLSWYPPDPLGLADPNHPEEVQYVVYFDPNELLVAGGDPSVRFGPQFETEFYPSPALVPGTQYYWRVDIIDPNFGVPITYPGVVWTFTTIPPKAGLVFPADGAGDVAQNAILEWYPGLGAIEHDVYFGTDQILVTEGDPSVHVATQTEDIFGPNLDWDTTYYWRIDEIFVSGGEPEQGDVWSFTTGIPVCEYELEGDVDNNCVFNLEDLARMAGNWLICNLTNGYCP